MKKEKWKVEGKKKKNEDRMNERGDEGTLF